MSQLIDRLKQALRDVAPPMGFRAARTTSKPRMLLVASLPQAGAGNLAELVAGADAGLMPITKPGSGARVLKEVGQAVPDIPWGAWLENASREGIRKIGAAGGDFVVFPAAKMSLAILEAEKVGKVLAVEALVDEGLLRTVNELPADAIFITGLRQGEPLTWHHLMLFRRFTDLLTKPVLVPVPMSIAANELQVLWETGVDGVVVEVAPGQPAGGLKRLRQMIDGLTLPSKRKRMKTRALLPGVRGEASRVADEEEEED